MESLGKVMMHRFLLTLMLVVVRSNANSDQNSASNSAYSSDPNSALSRVPNSAPNSPPNRAFISALNNALNSAYNSGPSSALNSDPNSAPNSAFISALHSAYSSAIKSTLKRSPNSDPNGDPNSAYNSDPNSDPNGDPNSAYNSDPNSAFTSALHNAYSAPNSAYSSAPKSAYTAPNNAYSSTPNSAYSASNSAYSASSSAPTSAYNHLPASVSGVSQMATGADVPFDFLLEEGSTTLSPTMTPEESNYEYNYNEEDDYGKDPSDPSTWKLLPIQIPDDLVSNAIVKEVVVTPSTVPPYPTPLIPQYRQHPGATDPLPPYHPETRQSIGNGHGGPLPYDYNWDHHEYESDHKDPQPHDQDWDRYDTESGHINPESLYENWDHHGIESDHKDPEPHHQNWDYHIDTDHRDPTPQHHISNHHSIDHTAHRNPRPSHHLHHNWTHTTDGYHIRNHHAEEEEEEVTQQRPATYPSRAPQHPMLPRPSAWNWKPPDAPSWHQNIVERISQHLPSLPAFPALPKLRLPGLGSLPTWVFGERVHQIQGQNLPQVQGESQVQGKYVHQFYPLVPANDPLQHLNGNPDRHHRPVYTYPPRQVPGTHNTLDGTQNIEKFTGYQSQYSPVGGDDSDYSADDSLTQHHTATTLQYSNQGDGHQAIRDDTRVSQQKPYTGQPPPPYPHHTLDPRRPFHTHASPQRILKIPQHPQHHHSPPHRYRGAWEGQQDNPSHAHHQQRNPYRNRPTQNWASQQTGNPGSGYVPSYTHEEQNTHTYSPHTQPPQDYATHAHSHHQQGLASSWYSENHQELNTFIPDVQDNILGPLSELLSRPFPLDMIFTFSNQHSIIERLTGVAASPTPSFVIPGGLLVLGLGLALFYFNFVWYPTPVVTAKIFKMLSDSDGALSEGQQRAVGEVYRVFQGLEAEYKHDPSVSSSSCRSQLVCQVHHELPGLWRVTQAYAALAKSSLASGPEGNSLFSGYETAARRGSKGDDCSTLYPECPLTTGPIKATLKRLLALLRNA